MYIMSPIEGVHSMKRSFPLLALLVALVLLAAACGGSDDEAGGNAAAPAQTQMDETETEAMEAEAEADIVDTAVAAGSFTTLADLLTQTGLAETLKGDGPFTVFAPTDEAFAALPEGTLEELGKPENREQLEAILLYHVAEGEAASSDLSDGQEVGTVQGDSVTVSIDGGTVMVDDATVTSADVQASNGVIHVVDAVLMPPAS
jgi:uncharacterized surface protein with fasciclin (FAS1) repeats